MTTAEIWIEGAFTVVMLPTGHYQAQVRLAGSNTIRIGEGSTPANAIKGALD